MANQVAYGFVNLLTLFDRRITQVGVSVVDTAIQQSFAEHSRVINALRGLFAERRTDAKVRFTTPAISRLQPLDEHGRPRPMRGGGQYDVAFPLQDAGAALAQTFKARAKMTVGEVNELVLQIQTADIRWLRDHILAALFANNSWTFTDDRLGALTIKGLANGDTDIYQVVAGTDAGVTDNHYIAQTQDLVTANDPFPIIRAELQEHPENGGDVLALMPTALRTKAELLTAFNPIRDPNITPGANIDVVIGSLSAPVPGIVFGYHDSKVWLVEWPTLPANNIVALTTDGIPPLVMREHPEPELQGFVAQGERNDIPYLERVWARYAGFGGWNRVGAVCYQVSNGDTIWDQPTGYSSPMA